VDFVFMTKRVERLSDMEMKGFVKTTTFYEENKTKIFSPLF